MGRVPIDPEFFNDGHCVLLVSSTLGGSGMEPDALSDAIGWATTQTMTDLLTRNVCLPIFFGADCCLDGSTLFVIDEALTEDEERGWVASLTAKVAVPDGRLVLVSGGGDGDELARAISGQPPDPDYVIYQSFDVAPGDHRIDVLAYRDSTSVALLHEELDEEEISARYADRPDIGYDYVIRVTPEDGDVPIPELVDEIEWPGLFRFR
jgi:hypothetical protein